MARSVSTTLLYTAVVLIAMTQAPTAMAQDPAANGQPDGARDPNQAALDEERRRLDQEIANRQAEEERVRREAEQQQQQKTPEQINAERENADRLLREAQDRQRIEAEAQQRVRDQEAAQQQQQQQQQQADEQRRQQEQQQQQQNNPQEDEQRRQLEEQQRQQEQQRRQQEQQQQEEEKRQAEEKLIQQRMQEMEQQKQQQQQQDQQNREQELEKERIFQEQQVLNRQAEDDHRQQKERSDEELERRKEEQDRLTAEHDRVQAEADERRLRQLKEDSDAKTKDIIGDADVGNDKLQEGDILITGRTGVNGIVNGHFKLLPNKQFHGRPSYAKMRKVQTGPEAIDLAVWWSSGKWYVGLLNEIGSDAAYAFIPSQAALPDQANGVWSIWDGKSWVQDDRVRAVGTGPRKLHVGNGDEYGPGDDDYNEEEYMAMYEEKRKAAEVLQQKTKKADTGDGPVPVLPHHVPKKIHFRSSCPEGHTGCSAKNLCKSCPSECETCQNIRETDKYGQCSAADCFTCQHGYKHVQKHTDGRGYCESAGSQMMVYIIGGIAAVLLFGAAVYVFCCNDKRGGRRNVSNLPY